MLKTWLKMVRKGRPGWFGLFYWHHGLTGDVNQRPNGYIKELIWRTNLEM